MARRPQELPEVTCGWIDCQVPVRRRVQSSRIRIRPHVTYLQEQVEAFPQDLLPAGDRGDRVEDPTVHVADDADLHVSALPNAVVRSRPRR